MMEAARSIAEGMTALKARIEDHAPQVVVMEQSVGLLSHHRPLLRWLQGRMNETGYEWRAAVVNAADHGSWARRRRILWIGVRLESMARRRL